MSVNRKAILVISSHVIRGSVGSRSSVFVFEQFGFPVWQMMTVSLTWQPDHGHAHRLIVSDDDFAAWAADIASSAWAGEIGTVLTGYFGAASQVGIAADLVSALKVQNPDLVYYCDPIIGDDQGLYVDEDIATNIRQKLLPLADIIKPNRAELEWFVGRKLHDNKMIVEAISELGAKKALITSSYALLKNKTANLYMDDKNIWLAEHRLVEHPVSGLGDLTGALFYARLLHGESIENALRHATSSVQHVLNNTLHFGADELMLTYDRRDLFNPTAPVDMRHIQTKDLK